MNTQTKNENEIQSTKTDVQTKPRTALVKGTKKNVPPPECKPYYGPNW